MLNPNCNGGHCLAPVGEVRLYPTGGGGNLILCRRCFAMENRYRFERVLKLSRGRDLAAVREAHASFPQVSWDTAKVYEGGS